MAQDLKKTVKKKMIAGIISIFRQMMDASSCNDSDVIRRCELCRQILPRARAASGKEVLGSVACALTLAIILGPAAYFGIQWIVDHDHGPLFDPPWHEPLNDWELN